MVSKIKKPAASGAQNGAAVEVGCLLAPPGVDPEVQDSILIWYIKCDILMGLRDTPAHLCHVSNGRLNQPSPEQAASGRVYLIQLVLTDLRDGIKRSTGGRTP